MLKQDRMKKGVLIKMAGICPGSPSPRSSLPSWLCLSLHLSLASECQSVSSLTRPPSSILPLTQVKILKEGLTQCSQSGLGNPHPCSKLQGSQSAVSPSAHLILPAVLLGGGSLPFYKRYNRAQQNGSLSQKGQLGTWMRDGCPQSDLMGCILTAEHFQWDNSNIFTCFLSARHCPDHFTSIVSMSRKP